MAQAARSNVTNVLQSIGQKTTVNESGVLVQYNQITWALWCYTGENKTSTNQTTKHIQSNA